MMVEAHCIAPNLWQGSAPMPGGGLRRAGFDVVVFCAEEFQPPSSMYPGVLAIHAPNDDNGSRAPTRLEIETARKASRLVAAYVAEGRKVLVTCMAGRNRSGLVTAMAICRLYGVSGREAMWHVKRKRRSPSGEALTNPQFESLLEGYHAWASSAESSMR
jgi:protein-tyrosine phosphatase